jgi:hypothetical protein
MDEITRAVELTKARLLEIDAALLSIAVDKCPQDYESLAKRIREIAVDMKEQCREIRATVAQHEPNRD